MGVTVKVEVEVLDGLGRTVSRHFARSNEASEALRHLDVDQMGRMELVPVSQQRSLRITVAAGSSTSHASGCGFWSSRGA